MNTWSDGEIETLIRMWPHSSAGQIARCMHRSRESICGKVLRLRAHGVAIAWGGSRGKGKLFSVNPRVRQKPVAPGATSGSKSDPHSEAPLAMRPCLLLELDDTRCHWPLGNVNDVATKFCGGNAAPGRRYCPHHARLAQRN